MVDPFYNCAKKSRLISGLPFDKPSPVIFGFRAVP
jgi:hypothetical protein